jgi:hypothetical protein
MPVELERKVALEKKLAKAEMSVYILINTKGQLRQNGKVHQWTDPFRRQSGIWAV